MKGIDPSPVRLVRETLLNTLLCAFPDMQRREFRRDVLTTAGLHMEVAERDIPREHVRAIVQSVLGSPRPSESLRLLEDALRRHAAHDQALPWLELAVASLTDSAPLPEGIMLRLIEVLRKTPYEKIAYRTLARYTADCGGSALAADQSTVPEVLLWLATRRGPVDPGPLLRFATRLNDDPHIVGTREGEGLRALLSDLNVPATNQADDRLIIQIRLEAAGPDHPADERYLLRGAYYRQRPPDGPLERVNLLLHDESFSKDELIGKAPSQLTQWAALAQELHRAGGRVRVEFILPSALLGHEAELWAVGRSGRAIGHNFPVVVRSLERYSDPWINPEPWRRRWDNLLSSRSDDALRQIEWPSLEIKQPGELANWLSDRGDVACLGLCLPYNELQPAARQAVDDALLTEGVPVMLWRRDSGDPNELLTALRPHGFERLSELPDTLLRCRRAGRFDKDHVSQHITLLWDDPYCVDPAQDWPFEGMA
ncbi:hypothetical protein GCM10010415_74980 [Streptomyces atrovirens]|uniref:vWA-MoxR associated protein C-terminal domain-containing protein n=1 Tax=Streptomyces atrovirens TaxID=285556 RepID=A0ABW0DM43_9ACTN